MKTIKYTRGAMLLAGAMLLSAGAMADDLTGTMTRSETVQYKPSMAATEAGAEQLYKKLQSAAARVCRNPADRIAKGEAYYSCTGKALAKAVKDVNLDAVAAIYLDKNKVADREGTVTVAKR